MELLQALFENADIPAEFKEKTTTLFEAAVDEKVKSELVTIQETYDVKLDEAKEAFITESTAKVDTLVEATIIEWAKENAVGLDSQIKGQIAESFLGELKTIFEKADIELNGGDAGKEIQELQEAKAALVKEAEDAKLALKEAQEQLVQMKVKEIVESMTEDLAETQAIRVAKLCEAFDFKSEDDFRKKAAMVVEAITGAPLKQEAKGTIEKDTPLKDLLNDPGVGAPPATPSTGAIKATVDTDGTHVPVTGSKPISGSQIDTASGDAPVDTVVVKPNGASVPSAEGDDGKPKKTLKEQYEDQVTHYAPHLHSDLISATLGQFR